MITHSIKKKPWKLHQYCFPGALWSISYAVDPSSTFFGYLNSSLQNRSKGFWSVHLPFPYRLPLVTLLFVYLHLLQFIQNFIICVSPLITVHSKFSLKLIFFQIDLFKWSQILIYCKVKSTREFKNVLENSLFLINLWSRERLEGVSD